MHNRKNRALASGRRVGARTDERDGIPDTDCLPDTFFDRKVGRRGFLVGAASLPALYLPASARPQLSTPQVIPHSDNVVASGTAHGPGSVSTAILPLQSRTVWDPGVPGGVPADDASPSTRQDRIGPATQHGPTLGTGTPTSKIQSALDAAGAVATRTSRRFVKLGPGIFESTTWLSIPSYVILRGTSTGIGNRQTTLRQTSKGTIVSIWGAGDAGQWGDVRNVVGVASKGDTTITVDNASNFSVGDILTIDHLRDGSPHGGPVPPGIQYNVPKSGSWVWSWSSLWYQRQPYSTDNGTGWLFPDSEGWRHISERVEVLAKNGNTLTIWNGNRGEGKPLHITHHLSPQVYRCAGSRTDVRRYAGIEDLRMEPHGTGRVITINGAAFCWAKNVEIDGVAQKWSGRHCQLFSQTYRCEVRDSYFHESGNYNQGGNAYGLNLSGTNNLIENNVVLKLNKPIVMECSNGGNVVAYNYVDEAVLSTLTNTWQEAAISTHASFVHHELFEGNYSPNIGIDSTHGNNGFNTIFRNWCRGRNTSGHATGYNRAVFSDGWNMNLNSIGNVLWSPGIAPDHLVLDPSVAPNAGYLGVAHKSAYLMGSNAFNPTGFSGSGGADNMDDGTAASYLHRHMDYVYGFDELYNNPKNTEDTLPNSLYLTAKPAFFGDHDWPWVDPTGATHGDRIKTLPAKARFDSATP